MAKNLRFSTVAIANSATVSSTLTLENSRIPLAIDIPSGVAGTTLSFNVSSDGSTFRQLYYEGTQYTLTYAAGRYVSLDRNKLEGVKYIQLVTNSAQTVTNNFTVVSGE